MGDANDFDKTEYDNLRTELIFHQTNASTIFALNIAGMGIGVTASAKLDAALLVLAILSCVLWFRYSDHVIALFRIAAYFELELRPRVVARLKEPVLGWEGYLRKKFTPRKHTKSSRFTLDSRMGIVVASGAFLAPPPLLCVAFVLRQWPDTAGFSRVLLVVASAVTAVVWLYSTLRGIYTVRELRQLDNEISSAAELLPGQRTDA
ncbi:hypothetical protein [Amycolatopsis vastitatis]|uniref:Integral membrane protein n=1 Tax=Amycolatopsis vastitatis TaxID=1905142 RepID=A0A229TFH2_9PSEU|nr:hypothetical protein [Amycolatopsis vastitatis]OXM69770.1 hypothetical protein CF165_09720 [Amycolatopsis vastitatis]